MKEGEDSKHQQEEEDRGNDDDDDNNHDDDCDGINNNNKSVAVVDVSFDTFIVDASNRIASQFDSRQMELKRDFEIQLNSRHKENAIIHEQMDDLVAALGEMTLYHKTEMEIRDQVNREAS